METLLRVFSKGISEKKKKTPFVLLCVSQAAQKEVKAVF